MIAECSLHDVSGCIPKVIILIYGFIYRQPVYRIPHIGIGFVFHVLGLHDSVPPRNHARRANEGKLQDRVAIADDHVGQHRPVPEAQAVKHIGQTHGFMNCSGACSGSLSCLPC